MVNETVLHLGRIAFFLGVAISYRWVIVKFLRLVFLKIKSAMTINALTTAVNKPKRVICKLWRLCELIAETEHNDIMASDEAKLIREDIEYYSRVVKMFNSFGQEKKAMFMREKGKDLKTLERKLAEEVDGVYKKLV